jgi:hypothetical protein
MKRYFVLLPISLFMLVQTAHARSVRVFVIGNSFSGNATRYLSQLAEDGKQNLIIGRAELPGHSLRQHWSYVEAAEANPEDPKGRPYANKTQSLKELLAKDKWDIVTIQQNSMNSSNVESYRPYAQNLRDYIKKQQPQAEVVIHQTWAYRKDAQRFGLIDGGGHAQNQQGMWEKSRAAYNTVAKEINSRIIPVGDAFWNVTSNPKWAYKKDESYDFQKPNYPNLPIQTNSLYTGYSWKKSTAPEGSYSLTLDANHANSAGCYLGGLVWYGFLFGKSPEKLTFRPPNVSEKFASHLRKVAWQTLKKTPAAKKAP